MAYNQFGSIGANKMGQLVNEFPNLQYLKMDMSHNSIGNEGLLHF